MVKSLLINTIKGLKWSALAQVSRQIFQYLTTIILVGLISPNDFGLMAMAMVVIGLLDMFKDLGTSSAIIKEENPSSELKCSIFWVNISFGLIIFAIIYFTSPFIAEFFNSERVSPVLQLLSLSFLIAGFSVQQKALLEKELSFQKLSLIELFSSAVAFSIAVYLAFAGFGVWSLVWQVITSTFLNTVLIWIFSNWRPQFIFSFSELRKITAYSSNLMGFNIINHFARNGDYFLIGKYLGDHLLGHYYLAYRIMLYPVQNITLVISRVIFPAFSKIQHQNERLRDAYVSITNSIALITFPMMAGLAFVSFNFTQAFFSESWDTILVANVIIILAPVGALQSIMSTVGIIYQVKGKTDWMFKWGLFSAIVTLVGFIIGLKWGIIGVAISYLVTNLLMILPVFLIPFKLIKLPIIQFFRSFELTILAVIGMLLILFLTSCLLPNYLSNILILVILILAGVISYMVFSLLINRKQLKEVKSLYSNYYYTVKSN